MIQKLVTTSHRTATSILNIQIPAYEIEAKYINSTAIPRLYDTVADIQSCDEIFYGYFYEDTLAGFISFKIDEEEVDIHRLVVSPDHFHKGIATKLLLYIFDMFSSSKTYIVQTGKENIPALSLYKKHGFIEVQNIVLPDGVILTSLKKTENNK
ncbi:N-acetyltransferase [Bacillus thuringiensis serovar pingluonsis]|uniref:N-acetyltransferase n=1 Tax=Bacillus thuringiensis serovar pingluonsis TaxID=180881 RepID=A0A243AXX9_BACTU|nr:MULTISPECIES: GNAT family N-acetyltransferase [Bacillus cereus group]EEL44785.1 acetyltransferase, GNAT [Bacillus cereus Rock3-42]MCU5439615.1 GNAT family N-acetyltransferase [Bacillus cereus]MEB9684649.1 GNAT family N-acetyltransferase [Bacillus anthracis]OTY35165.1 N-acetyltransferase [Bacillus thuringiensis serovar pingluonsis]